MNTLHVVHQVVVAWESIAGDCSLASCIFAKIGLGAVAVQAMCFAFMTQQTGGRRESEPLVFALWLHASILLADEWLQMGVDVFAVVNVSNRSISDVFFLTYSKLHLSFVGL